jgi:tetratricopeptide (TPR) repeat protein
VALRPQSPGARVNLGIALYDKGAPDEAIAAYQEAIRIKKDYAEAHSNLGVALAAKGRLDAAINECREALRIKKDFAEAHNNLGLILQRKGQLDAAIDAFREALRIKKDYVEVHSNLGVALWAKGRLDEAIAECREALRLKEDYPEAHCNLGLALVRKGRFQEGAEELRRGHELGSRNPRWPYPSAQWLRNAERLAELDARLPELLEGQDQPADATDRLALAEFCQQHKKLYAAAVRWYAEAFAADPNLLAGPPSGQRYNAACAAALASCGQGQDAVGLGERECARLRGQGLDWLRADLEAWRRLLEKEPAKARPVVAQQMQHWLGDPDFTSVRGPEALDRLPAAERHAWQKLWADVAHTLARAHGTTAPETKAKNKVQLPER